MITESLHDATPRRGFIGRMLAAGAALAAAPLASRAALAAEPRSPDDDRWLAGIKGKHRQVFDLVNPNDGFGLAYAMNFLDQNHAAYGLADRDLTAVVSIRHFATPLAFNDAIWSKYKVGEFLKLNDPKTKAPAERNYFYHIGEGDLPFPGMAIDRLQARGAIVTVCQMATGVLSSMTGQRVGVAADEAKKEWMANVVPGAVFVPAGVLAINRAQERGCTYCYGG